MNSLPCGMKWSSLQMYFLQGNLSIIFLSNKAMPFLPVYPCLKYCSDINHQPIPPAFQMLSQMI